MGRMMAIAFFIMAFSMGMSLLHQVNYCYFYGNSGAIVNGFDTSGCPSEPGMNRTYIPFTVAPLWDYNNNLRDQNNTRLVPSLFSSFSNGLIDLVTYAAAPLGLEDAFGFFTWTIGAGRFIVNTFFMPLFGFPEFLSSFYVPLFLGKLFSPVIFACQMLGLYEFFSGRTVV